MDTLLTDMAYLEAGIPEVEAYLLSEALYWPVRARGYRLPRMTLAGLLLALERIRAGDQPVASLAAQLEAARSKWRVAWENKAAREYRARFGLWKGYLEEYRENPEQHADAYPYQVRYRVMLHLLEVELPVEPKEMEALKGLDAFLRVSLAPSDFLWDPRLEAAFPYEVYWYLYGKLRT